jgi:hypothetical protein
LLLLSVRKWGGSIVRRSIILLGIVGILFVDITLGYAEGPAMRRGPMRMPTRELPLTPDQEARYLRLRQKFNEETTLLRGALLTKRLEVQFLWTNPKADPGEIVEKERELRDLQNEMGEKIMHHQLDVRKLLSSEQIPLYGAELGLGPVFGRGPMVDHGMGHHAPRFWR